MIDNSIIGNLRVKPKHYRPEIKAANSSKLNNEKLTLQRPQDADKNVYTMFATENRPNDLFYGYKDGGGRWHGVNVIGAPYNEESDGSVIGWLYVNINFELPNED